MNQELKNLQQKYAINLFDWYDFSSKSTKKESDSKILVLGDIDDNFIFQLLKRVFEITIVLETKDAYKVISSLNLPYTVTIIKDLIDDDERLVSEKLKGKKFNYVILPSITKKLSKIYGISLKEIISNLISTYTNDEGVVLLAFDNKKSFDIIGGCRPDTDSLLFSYEDIESSKIYLNEKYPYSDTMIYYPLPEYKFPLKIYSNSYMPKLEDETAMTRNLVMLNEFSKFCHSYILIFDAKKSEEIKERVIYVKYNLNRTKRFALLTSIIEDSIGKKKVVKKAVYDEANSHVERMLNNENIIRNKNVVVLKHIDYVSENNSIDGKAYIVYPFIEGKMLTDVIIDRINNGEKEKEVITEYMIKLIGRLTGKVSNYNLDCTFQNVIVCDDKLYVIDSEWASDETTEVEYLRYRILKYFYKSSKQSLSYSTFREMLRDFGISSVNAERYERIENEFQSTVHENINNLDITKYEELNPSFEKLYYVKAELSRVRDQLDRITGENNIIDFQANKLNETIRLTNVHVHNLESHIQNLNERVEALTLQNQFLFKRESLIFKIFRKLKEYAKKILPPETIRSKICKYIYRTIRHPFKMLKTYFTSRGRNRIVGDFMIGDAYFECGKVDLPKCEIPLVSIIIPCYNQIRYTYKCLYSIMKNTNPEVTPYEVIIADDVSTDTTKNIKKYVDNIVVSRNETNLGFLKNCNNAAKLAKGEFIYFLNNDTEVHENYLEALINRFKSDDSIGMVGSKLVFSNGTLQEAGGIIWSDGEGANYGRNEDPNDFKFNYVKEVDYISGASIMIKKSLWNIIGGFDERYAPAYCEDSDLAFEVRKYGYKVVYEPLSVITHFEGVSCGTDTTNENSIKSYQVENCKKLKEKWAIELMNQFPHTDKPDFFRARERAMNKKTILFIDHYVPTWDKDAGSKTVFSYMMMFIKKGYSVKCLGDNFIKNSPYGDKLQEYGVEVLYGTNLQATLWEYLQSNKRNFDYVFLNRPHIACKYIDFIRQNMHTKIIYYGHDLHYMRLQREYDLMGDDNALNEFKSYRNLEYSLLYKADISYYPSYKEVEEIKKTDETLRVKVINAYMFDEKEIFKRDFKNTKNLLFVGGFMHEPNKDAVRWLHESIMPRVKARNPEINLTVVGSNATDEIINICKEGGYNLLGFVPEEELLELYKITRIVVAPLRYGAGIKGKIIEAMANGAAIITTSCGAEGIVEAENFMKIQDGAAEFADEIIKLYDNFDSLNSLSLESQKIINTRFTMDAAWDIIKEDFAEEV